MADSCPTLTERILAKDRWIIAAGLTLLTLLAWTYIISGAGTGMSLQAMSRWEFPPGIPAIGPHSDWTLAYAVSMLLMWWVMMIAMMIPSASPTILLYARLLANTRTNQFEKLPERRVRSSTSNAANSPTLAPTAHFAAGYLTAWLIFSMAAVFLQWLLQYSGLLHGMTMASTSHLFSGLLLIAAGLYQLSTLKAACLRHCRSPAEFLSSHWRKGAAGAAQMGFAHGLYCVGCCWCLMVLLFVGGAMNLLWIAGLGGLVLVEKTLPSGLLIARLSAILLLSSGTLLIYTALP
ncbi:MAG: DUF2182 domain-containing protein [Gammaproteobacteria bacterium]|nr:DUF2182 domain-containing protein [Gammaproteobacteria bacterium]